MKHKRLITLMTFILILMTACQQPKSDVDVYSVHGANENISINNGLIIRTDETDKFVGGDLTFKGKELTGVAAYEATFSYLKNNEEVAIVTSQSSSNDKVENDRIHLNMGTISAEDLLSDTDMALIKDTLFFSLRGQLVSGEDFDYHLTLDVNKAY